MKALHLQEMDMVSPVPNQMISDVVKYFEENQKVSVMSKCEKRLDFSKYTRKGKAPLGMDAQEWVRELRENDRI